MKILKVSLALTLIAAAISIAGLTQKLYAADLDKPGAIGIDDNGVSVRKIELAIDADRDKIIEESKAIGRDKRKLKEAEKASDKANAVQIRQGIKDREAVIKGLKDGIRGKKVERYNLMNGKQKDAPRRSRDDLKY